jgi:hypothetical protein
MQNSERRRNDRRHSDRRLLELALLGLESERRRINAELDDIRQRLASAAGSVSRGIVTPIRSSIETQTRTSPNKGRTMTPAQKRKISQAMKARWAARKKAA